MKSIALLLVWTVAAVSAESGCPEGFEFVFDRCLHKHAGEMLHDDARDMCKAGGYNMVIPDNEEFYKALMKWDKVQEEVPKTKFWMGISNQFSADDSVHYWEIDMKVPVTWSLWQNGQPKKSPAKCATVNRGQRQWYGRNCAKAKAIAVCEAPAFTCPDDFFYVHDRCMRVYKQRTTHNEAKALCEEQGYEMALPNNPAFFKDFMDWAEHPLHPDASRSYWLGITNQGSEDAGVYYWEDDSKTPVSWTEWRADQPWSVADRCVIAKDKDRSWLSQRCSTKKALPVCQTPARECPPGYDVVDGKCLQKFGRMTHDEAKNLCESTGAAMITPDSQEYFNSFMEWDKVQEQKETTAFWMGISNQESDDVTDFYWEKVLRLPVTWGSWAKNRPTNKRDRCVAANNKNKAWADQLCRTQKAIALCQAPFQYCPDGFDFIYGRCLQKNLPPMKHDQAKQLCEEAGYKMFMPNSEEYLNAFLSWDQVTEKGQKKYWIGATNRGDKAGNYCLEDGNDTPLVYAPWAQGQPLLRHDRCTQVNKVNGKYYSYKCSFKRAVAVCETPMNS